MRERTFPRSHHSRAHSIRVARLRRLRTISVTQLAAFAVVVAAVTCAPRRADANPGITGYSGKPYNGVTDTCKTVCHSGNGTPPTLNITVPSAMTAGDTAEVTIVVNGTRTRTSMNAALSDGVKATKGQNTEVPFPVETPGEVAAVAPPPNGANGTYKFSFVAPNKNGPITLWVAGMSASGSGTGGDGVATATRTITVSGATSTPADGGSPDPEDGGPGTDEPADGGAKSDAGTSNGRDDADDGEDDGASSGSRGRRVTGSEDAGGCASARAATLDGGAIASAAIAVLGLVLSRRRMRRR